MAIATAARKAVKANLSREQIAAAADAAAFLDAIRERDRVLDRILAEAIVHELPEEVVAEQMRAALSQGQVGALRLERERTHATRAEGTSPDQEHRHLVLVSEALNSAPVQETLADTRSPGIALPLQPDELRVLMGARRDAGTTPQHGSEVPD